MVVLCPGSMLEIARKLKAEGKHDDGRVLVRRGQGVLALKPEELGPDDEVIPDPDPCFRKAGRPRVVVEAWEDIDAPRPRVRTPKERLYSPLGLHEAAKRARERAEAGRPKERQEGVEGANMRTNPTMPPRAVIDALCQARSLYMIDDPSPFDGVKVWKEHLRDLRTLRQTAQVKRMIANAIETIEWVREQEPFWKVPDAGLPPAQGGPMGTNPTLPPQFVLDALEDCILERSSRGWSRWSWCGCILDEDDPLEEDDDADLGEDEAV